MKKYYDFIIKNPMRMSCTGKKDPIDGALIYNVLFENVDILPIGVSEDKDVTELKTLIRKYMRDDIDQMTIKPALLEKYVKISQHILAMSIPDCIVERYKDYERPVLKCRVYTSYGSDPHHIIVRFTACDIYEDGDMKINFFNGSNKFNKPEVKRVIYNDPATIIFWSDGTKTIVKCTDDEPYDPEKGFMAAVTKKYFDEKYGWNIRKHVKPEIEARNC